MTIKEKITQKELSVKELLITLRNNLNSKSLRHSKNPQDWDYLTSLSFTELRLNEIVEFLENNAAK
jgi:hypothetical protein